MGADFSLDVLIEISLSERTAQLSHFDSLDTKAGLVLGIRRSLDCIEERVLHIGNRVDFGVVGHRSGGSLRGLVLAAPISFDRPTSNG